MTVWLLLAIIPAATLAQAVPAPISPPPASARGLVFDSTRKIAVLFGGSVDTNIFLDTSEQGSGAFRLDV